MSKAILDAAGVVPQTNLDAIPRYYERDEYKTAAKALDDLLDRSPDPAKWSRDQKRLAGKYVAEMDDVRHRADVDVNRVMAGHKTQLDRRTKAAVDALTERMSNDEHC